MRKDWLLVLGSVAVTVVVSLALIRWFAPQLLGIRPDMQLVRVKKDVVPFFEHIFRGQDYGGPEFLLKDPYTGVRARPLMDDLVTLGPNDILGFRNRAVPHIADVVVIGDSQTYGNNATLELNWPSQLKARLSAKRPIFYSMATGGWGAVQYLNMVEYATVFQPRIIIVAYYSGNDPIESYQIAYSVDRWAALRPDLSLDVNDIPKISGFPPAESEQWKTKFLNGSMMIFTPKHRLASNLASHSAVKAGYDIMLAVARHSVRVASSANARVVFTVIPTKELVYAERLRRERIDWHPDYERLIELESKNIAELERGIRAIPGATYVDLVAPMQAAAMRQESRLYPPGIDGHPLAEGYSVIADALSPVVGKMLLNKPRGLVKVPQANGPEWYCLVRGGDFWLFASAQLVARNGWNAESAKLTSWRDMAGLQRQGVIDTAEPALFGPASVRNQVR